MTAPPERAAFGPITLAERIVSVDIVRGFALWGVLLINMMSYGALRAGRWPDPIDQLAFWAQRFLFEEKSWRLFSFLFGFGFSLQMTRARDRGAPFLPLYVRRLALLLGFGFFNHLFFSGDILTAYALLGAVLLIFRRWSLNWILVVAAFLLAVDPIDTAIRRILPSDPEAAAEIARNGNMGLDWSDRGQQTVRVTDSGPIWAYWGVEAREFRRHADPRRHWQGSQSWLLFFSMFLLGLYAGKRRIFQDFDRHSAFVRRIFVWGMPLGLLAMSSDWILRDFGAAPLSPGVHFARQMTWAYGATALALSYAAGLVILARKARWKRILAPLGAMGRMALTVYLTQSIVLAALFHGYGLGLNERVGPAGVFGLAALIYAAQLAICVWWMGRFRFGPAEWLWRTLAYLRLQPMRLQPREMAGAKALIDGMGP